MTQVRRVWLVLSASALLLASTWLALPTKAQTGDVAATVSALQTQVAHLQTQAASNATATPSSALGTASPAASHQFGDGIFVVGKDITPGTYRTRIASSSCYYARLSGFSGNLDEIIENNITDGPAVITIKATDKGFESKRCGTWTTDLSRITASTTTFDDGIYIVGTDIQPGTYSNNPGSADCYYARLSGFGGSLNEILSNSVTDDPAVVTIAPTDKGFESKRCGTWTLQS